MRILVVEDSLSARTMLKDMLALRGHQVVAEAEDQVQAIDAYQSHKPDLVTLDLGLGKDSGLTVLKALRSLDPNARVLVITGNAQTFIRDQAAASGASGFVTKPITISELELAIALAISKR